jgi:hypothetical protein
LTPGTASSPAPYSGPSHAPVPSPSPSGCTPDGMKPVNQYGSDCCSQRYVDSNGNCNLPCIPDGQPNGPGGCCNIALNNNCVGCVPNGQPAYLNLQSFCCSHWINPANGNCEPKPVDCVLGAQISSDNACATAPCGTNHYQYITYAVTTPAQNGGSCINPKPVACPPNPCPLIASTPGGSTAAGGGRLAYGSRCYHDADCLSDSCTGHSCD